MSPVTSLARTLPLLLLAESSAWFQRDTISLGAEPGVVIAETTFGGMSPDGMRRWSKPASPIAFDAWSRPPTAP